ncbi:MAG: GFA family protein [Pseudomonadota bacterium]
MADDARVSYGQCRCAAVRFSVAAPPLITAACHCRGCQRMTASAFSVSALYPADRFKVIAGRTVLGGLRGATQHHFCAACMSWLFTYPEGLSDYVNVRITLLDDADSLSPFIETYVAEKVSWASTPAEFSFAHQPSAEELPGLVAEFASRQR